MVVPHPNTQKPLKPENTETARGLPIDVQKDTSQHFRVVIRKGMFIQFWVMGQDCCSKTLHTCTLLRYFCTYAAKSCVFNTWVSTLNSGNRWNYYGNLLELISITSPLLMHAHCHLVVIFWGPFDEGSTSSSLRLLYLSPIWHHLSVTFLAKVSNVLIFNTVFFLPMEVFLDPLVLKLPSLCLPDWWCL